MNYQKSSVPCKFGDACTNKHCSYSHVKATINDLLGDPFSLDTCPKKSRRLSLSKPSTVFNESDREINNLKFEINELKQSILELKRENHKLSKKVSKQNKQHVEQANDVNETLNVHAKKIRTMQKLLDC